MDVIEVDHARAGERRDGIEARDISGLRPIESIAQHLAMARLHQIIAKAARVIGISGLRAFRIDENIRLVGAFVDCRATQLCEPNRF